MRTDFVLVALEQAIYDRQPDKNALIHHSYRCSQCVSILNTKRLALAETINGLYNAELIHRRAPWKTKESLELATLEWVYFAGRGCGKLLSATRQEDRNPVFTLTNWPPRNPG